MTCTDFVKTTISVIFDKCGVPSAPARFNAWTDQQAAAVAAWTTALTGELWEMS